MPLGELFLRVSSNDGQCHATFFFFFFFFFFSSIINSRDIGQIECIKWKSTVAEHIKTTVSRFQTIKHKFIKKNLACKRTEAGIGESHARVRSGALGLTVILTDSITIRRLDVRFRQLNDELRGSVKSQSVWKTLMTCFKGVIFFSGKQEIQTGCGRWFRVRHEN